MLGTGLMGAPMAGCLLDAGIEVTVWNRTAAKAAPLLARGARPAASAAAAAAEAEVVLVVLADGPAVTDVLFGQGVAETLRPGSLVVDASSIPPATAQEHAERLARRQVAHLDAPVSGGTRGAASKSLSIMVGGAHEDFMRARAVLDALGSPTHVGGHGAGQLAKLVNQLVCGVMIGAVAEGLLFARASGCEPAVVREALRGGFADSTVLRQHGRRMLERDWTPGGKAATHLKDLRTAQDVASSLRLELPLLDRTLGLYEQLVDLGAGDLDHSAILLELERRNDRAPATDQEETDMQTGSDR